MSTNGENGREAAARAKGGGRWLLVALVVSLSLNMLIIGAIGAMVFMHRMGGAPEWMQRMHAQRMQEALQAGRRVAPLRLARPGLLLAALRRLMRQLPEERRKVLRPILRRHRKMIAQAYGDVAQARAALLQVMRQSPSDAEDAQVMARAWQVLRRKETVARQRVLDMLADFSQALTPKERALFADIVERRAKRRRMLRRS